MSAFKNFRIKASASRFSCAEFDAVQSDGIPEDISEMKTAHLKHSGDISFIKKQR